MESAERWVEFVMAIGEFSGDARENSTRELERGKGKTTGMDGGING